MKYIDDSNDPCTGFLDNLDLWLAGELDADHSLAMQAHHGTCVACQQETRLAREIDAVVQALPEQVCPELQLPATRATANGRAGLWPRSTRHGALPGHAFVSRLLATWRQPLVFIPALTWVLVMLLVMQLRVSDTPVDPQIVIVDGQDYTREEIMRAAEDLEIALRYLDKYASYPARVVHAELEQSRLPLPPPRENENGPAI